MPQAPIPFAAPLASADEELAGAKRSSVNAMVDRAGTIRMRPGLRAHSTLYSSALDTNASEITGIHSSFDDQVFAMNASGLYIVSTGKALLGAVAGSGRGVFTETEPLVVATRGSNPVKYVKSAIAMSMLANAPQCSHIAVYDSRLWANNVARDSHVPYTDGSLGTSYTNHEIWNNVFTATARPDPIVAIRARAPDLLVFGRQSTEIRRMTGGASPALVGGGDHGLAAEYAVTSVGDAIYWLDQNRRIIECVGGEMKVVSDDLDMTMFSNIEGCFAYSISTGNYNVAVFAFPYHQTHLAYQQGIGWSQWHAGFAGNFIVSCAAQRYAQYEQLVGTTDGRVLEMTTEVNTDDGDEIGLQIETGFINRGTDAYKICNCVRLVMRRGVTTDGGTVALSWRDGTGAWSQAISVSVGDWGDTDPVVELRSLGTYRRRQWRISFSGDATLVLVAASEEFEVLGG